MKTVLRVDVKFQNFPVHIQQKTFLTRMISVVFPVALFLWLLWRRIAWLITRRSRLENSICLTLITEATLKLDTSSSWLYFCTFSITTTTLRPRQQHKKDWKRYVVLVPEAPLCLQSVMRRPPRLLKPLLLLLLTWTAFKGGLCSGLVKSIRSVWS